MRPLKIFFRLVSFICRIINWPFNHTSLLKALIQLVRKIDISTDARLATDLFMAKTRVSRTLLRIAMHLLHCAANFKMSYLLSSFFSMILVLPISNPTRLPFGLTFNFSLQRGRKSMTSSWFPGREIRLAAVHLHVRVRQSQAKSLSSSFYSWVRWENGHLFLVLKYPFFRKFHFNKSNRNFVKNSI